MINEDEKQIRTDEKQMLMCTVATQDNGDIKLIKRDGRKEDTMSVLKYAERGQAGSYRHYTDQYETKLLLEKIDKVERKFIITTDDEKIMKTQQVVINELIAIRKKKKAKTQKEKLDADIRRVEQLDLCIGDYSQCYIQKVFINGSVGYLVYNRKEGQENNYIGELNLINQQHSILYQIMNKYELISYYG